MTASRKSDHRPAVARRPLVLGTHDVPCRIFVARGVSCACRIPDTKNNLGLCNAAQSRADRIIQTHGPSVNARASVSLPDLTLRTLSGNGWLLSVATAARHHPAHWFRSGATTPNRLPETPIFLRPDSPQQPAHLRPDGRRPFPRRPGALSCSSCGCVGVASCRKLNRVPWLEQWEAGARTFPAVNIRSPILWPRPGPSGRARRRPTLPLLPVSPNARQNSGSPEIASLHPRHSRPSLTACMRGAGEQSSRGGVESMHAPGGVARRTRGGEPHGETPHGVPRHLREGAGVAPGPREAFS